MVLVAEPKVMLEMAVSRSDLLTAELEIVGHCDKAYTVKIYSLVPVPCEHGGV